MDHLKRVYSLVSISHSLFWAWSDISQMVSRDAQDTQHRGDGPQPAWCMMGRQNMGSWNKHIILKWKHLKIFCSKLLILSESRELQNVTKTSWTRVGRGYPDRGSGGIDSHGVEDVHQSGENTILPVLVLRAALQMGPPGTHVWAWQRLWVTHSGWLFRCFPASRSRSEGTRKGRHRWTPAA